MIDSMQSPSLFNTTGVPKISSQYIFSKADEFGAKETKVEKKLNFLGSLLPNYAGLSGMKDDFARMLYASSSKLYSSAKLDNKQNAEGGYPQA